MSDHIMGFGPGFVATLEDMFSHIKTIPEDVRLIAWLDSTLVAEGSRRRIYEYLRNVKVKAAAPGQEWQHASSFLTYVHLTTEEPDANVELISAGGES